MKTIFRKVDARERLPEKEDCYFVFTEGKEIRNDEEGDSEHEFTHCGYHRFVNTFQGKYFSSIKDPKNERVTHWLEEIELPTDKEIKEKARKLFINDWDKQTWYQGAKCGRDFVLAATPNEVQK